MKILVVIPTYNEAINIKALLRALIKLGIFGLEILVIDDNSPDGTSELVRKFALECPSVNLITRSKKEGIGSAYLVGFKWGIVHGYEYIIQMDADFSHNPNDISRLLQAITTNKCDVVIGSRRISGGKIVGWNLFRKFFSWSAQMFSRLFLALPYKDITAGFRLFSRDAIDNILTSNINSNGYAFQEEVLYKLHQGGYKIYEIPVVFHDRINGQSKLGFIEVLAFFRLVFVLTMNDKKRWWLAPILIFLIWRIIIECIGRIVHVSPVISPWLVDPFPPLWARWDSGWYSSILQYGYQLRQDTMSNVTFFPLYPMLWKLVSLMGIPNFVSGILVSNILTFSGFILLYRWTLEAFDKNIARRVLIALCVYPASFFLIAAYSEATLFFLTSGLLFFTHRKNWLLASLCVGLASAARPVGILLWPTLLMIWLVSNNYRLAWKLRDFVALYFIPPIGLIIFSLYLWHAVGDPFAWLHGQSQAGREFVGPIKLLYAYTKNILSHGEYWDRHLVEMVALIFVIGSLRRLYRINPTFSLLALLNIIPSLLSNTLISIQRFVLMIVPIFLVVALQRKFIYLMYIFICVPLLILSISQFVNWRWAG